MTPQPASDAAMREAFEAWASAEGWPLLRPNYKDVNRNYYDTRTQAAYEAWQAAHSHARAEMEAEVAGAVAAEKARIVSALEGEADLHPCYEDAEVIRGCARLVEHDFSYQAVEDADIAIERTTLAEPQPTGAGEG